MTPPTYDDLQVRLHHIQDLARDYIKGFPEDKAVFELAAGVLAIAQHAIADPYIPIEQRPNCQASKPFEDSYIACHLCKFHTGNHYDSQRKLIWTFGAGETIETPETTRDR